METIKHFSHEHPLSVFEDKEVDEYEDYKPYLCSICGLPILSCPSYTCSINGCNFFLHKPCAQLPQQLKHPKNHPASVMRHGSLQLKPKSPPGDSDCHNKFCQNFTYKCSNCEFDIHSLVAVPTEIKIKHKSHKSHPLIASCRETSSLCDACGKKQNGFFFSCQECNFWIHQDCTLLPSLVKLASHPHPFILTYSLSDEAYLPSPRCIICEGLMLHNIGLYFCGQCSSYAHVSCATSNSENNKAETSLELIQLPDEGDTFPSLVIRRYLESNPIPDDKKLTIEKYHNHPLKFHDGISGSREACLVMCDVCIQPINISSPFYRCIQSDDCHFLAHSICTNLSSSVNFPFLGEFYKASLCPVSREWFFNSTFTCFFCHRPCNGFFYYIDIDHHYRLFFDLECIFAPNIIKHTSHGKHILFQTERLPSDNIQLRCCSGEPLRSVFRCVFCDFCIHIRCALLPKRTQHKFDEHPLELITPSSNEAQEHEYNYRFCEFCEKAIDQKYWYYGCSKCAQFFHINCIPSVGYLSKVKFGGTLDNISCHIHPLTLTRMLTLPSQRCGYCKEIIKGFVDEMAFHCSECDFWIHFSCARDSATDEKYRSMHYSGTVPGVIKVEMKILN